MIRKYIRIAAPAILFSAIAVAGALCLPKIVQMFIDQIRGGTTSSALLRWLALFIALAFSSVIFRFAALLLFVSSAQKTGEFLRLDLLQRIFSNPDSGRGKSLFTTLTHDIRSITGFLENGLPRISRSFWLYGFGIFFITGLDWKFILPALLGVSASLFIAFKWHSHLENWYRLEREEQARFQQSITRWFQEWELIKGQAREEEIAEDFEERSQNHLNASLRGNLDSAGLMPVIMGVWGAVSLAFIAIGAVEFRAGHLTVGELAAAFQYLVFFSMPTLDLCYGGDLWRKARLAWQNIISLRETLSNAAPRIFHPLVITKSPGTIHVVYPNGIQAEHLKRECVEKGGAFLEKRPIFFSRPLIENFLLTDSLPSEEEIEESLYSACLLNPDELPDFWLMRNPNTFSSGEKKRAALARIFLKKGANLWILDDPTAGLNAELAGNLLESLSRYKRDRTIVIFSDDERVRDWAVKEIYV